MVFLTAELQSGYKKNAGTGSARNEFGSAILEDFLEICHAPVHFLTLGTLGSISM
jgi:hypothetical protein